MQNKTSYQNKSSGNITDSEVAWTEGNLYYQFMHVLDMDYLESYYFNNWDKMYKVFEVRLMKSKVYIEKYATKQQWAILMDEKPIRMLLTTFKDGDSDFVSRFNNNKVKEILDIIKTKMDILEELRAKAGMNLLLNKIQSFRPAALGGDDFIMD